MSNETKFTKGNLIIDGDESTCFFNILEDEGDGHFFMVAENVTHLADAKLFKAAPKLYVELEGLSRLMSMLDSHTHPNIELDAVKDSIETLLAEARVEE